jgi:hypothetical protein
MKRFDIQTYKFSREIQEFVDSLISLCYSIGGAKLVDEISEEINYRLTSGEEFIRVISEVYERVRSMSQTTI